MNESTRRILVQTNDRAVCARARLVLASADIASNVSFQNGDWWLSVSSADADAAEAELRADDEDLRREITDATPPVRPLSEAFGGSIAGVISYGIIIGTLALASWAPLHDWPWMEAGSMRAGEVRGGSWWRVFTALTLHNDGQHLISNLAFGGVFGLLAGRILGGGIAWLAITLAGGLGNAINATVRDGNFVSIGASTAVFAALGVMVAHALRPRIGRVGQPMKRWSPLIGGMVLLGLVGVGDGGGRTDVVAHFTGFLGGLVTGWVGCRVPARWLSSDDVQFAAAATTILLIVLAWTVALNAV